MAKPVNDTRSCFRRWLNLPAGDLWEFDAEGLNWLRRKIVSGWRVFHLVWRGYRDDECELHASALTYYSLMSIVPLCALGLALVRVFGGDEIAHTRIRSEIARFGEQISAASAAGNGQETAMVADFVGRLNHYADWLFMQISQISFGTLGGIGLVVLLWMAIRMLVQVEHSLNRVWNAPARSLWRKCSDYLTLIVVVPFLAIAATTIPVASVLSRHLNGWLGGVLHSAGFAFAARQGTSLLLTCMLFVTVFLFVPNTRVRVRPALIGGVVTAGCFLLWLRLCVELQSGVIKYSKLYGGFAILPILLAWVYMSWQIVLFGAELSFACQNADTYGREQGARNAGFRARWQLALGLVVEMADALREGRPPVHAAGFARSRRISARLMNDVIEDLLQAGLVAGTVQQVGAYVLLQDPGKLTAAAVVRAVLDRGVSPESLGLGNLDQSIRAYATRAETAWAENLGTPVAQLAVHAVDPVAKGCS